MSVPSYDDRQINAVLTVCQVCEKRYYMTLPKPVCISCKAKERVKC